MLLLCVINIVDIGSKHPQYFMKVLFVCRKSIVASTEPQSTWNQLIRKDLIDYLIVHVGNAKYFQTLIVPLFGNLKFEKPDLYDPTNSNLELG
jgi:hypothetical protein